MKKIGVSYTNVLVELTSQEFLVLASKSHTGIPDGTEFSLKHVKEAAELRDKYLPKIKELSELAGKLEASK